MSVSPKIEFKNLSVFITGGGTGIGLATAKAFAHAGAKVAIGGRRQDVVDQALSEINRPEIAFGHTLDVTDRQQVEAFFGWAEKTIGPCDVLVQAAGINIKNRSIDNMTPEDWDRVMAINATGPYNCIYAVLPSMRKRSSGLIINISSIAGKRAIALGGVAYSASKFAMTALGTCVGNEVNQIGIRVTNVYPGEVNTPILEQRPSPVTDEHRERILQGEDVAQMILSIASLPAHVHIPEIVIKPISQGFF